MFWETKLAELEKLGTITLILDDPEGETPIWTVTLGTLSFTGPTKAAAVCELWSHVISNGFESGDLVSRWNGRWEQSKKPEPPKPEAPVVEEAEPLSFDPAD